MFLDRVKFKDGRAFIERIRKSGKAKGIVHRMFGQIITCRYCGNKSFASNVKIAQGYGESCSRQCADKSKERKHRYLANGYVLIFSPNHPFANKNGYVQEHRLVIEKLINRFLHKWEIVHHVDKQRNNNHIHNLMVFNNQGAHRAFDNGAQVKSEYIVFDGRKYAAMEVDSTAQARVVA